ncbi:MAG: hypothetical protein LBK26_03050 [Rickettsiales bacterium]|jgi:hypothetical protein|nr:hypothetical protein [Rickettsiales bacterium]
MKKLGIFFTICLFASGAFGDDFFAERTVTVQPAKDECVGTADKALCVFDTVIACVIRDEPELCKKVGLTYDQTMMNSVGYLVGKDYTYRPVDMYVNRRPPTCSFPDGLACAFNPGTGKNVAVDMSIRNNRKFGMYLKKEKGGAWSVIFATEFSCWSDEDCS